MACVNGCIDLLGHAAGLAQEEGEAMSGHTVMEVLPGYLQDRKARGIFCREYARSARYMLVSFADHVGKRRLKNIGPTHVEAWLASLDHLANSTKRQRLSAVRAFFRWAIRRGYARRNPADEVDAPEQPRTVPRALTADAVAKVLDACPDSRATLIVTCMVQQGLRCCEVSRLMLGDIDRTHRTMRVRGKGGHERILPIMEETQRALDDYLGDHPASAGPLIRSFRHCQRPIGAAYISQMVADLMRDAGVKLRARDGVGAHAGRHTCASDMLRGGAELRDIQAVLGHARLATTEIYLPHLVKGLEAAMEGRTYRTDINGP